MVRLARFRYSIFALEERFLLRDTAAEMVRSVFSDSGGGKLVANYPND